MADDDGQDDGDEESPGWAAIDAALAKLYGKTEPLHYAPEVPAFAGGDNPVDGISVYARSTPVPHWHFVTYGFTELHAKESDDPEISGFGFELTLRVARPDGETEPPGWALNFLQNLGRYAFGSGNGFGAGHKMNLNGPIALGVDTQIGAICFGVDPELGELETPHGHMQFLQVVGITVDEWELITEWNTLGLLDMLARRTPLWITELARRSLLADAALAADIGARVKAEGSSQESTFAGSATWSVDGDALRLTIGAGHVMTLTRMLRGRIAHGRPFRLVGKKGNLAFEPASTAGFAATAEQVTVRVSAALADEMQRAIVPRRGPLRFAALPGFVLDVVPTEIKDQAGAVVEVIG